MCFYSIAKYLLFAFNFILWAGGAAVLGVGIYLVTGDVDEVLVIGDVDFYYSGCYVLIAAGSFALVIGFLGCCGAMKESTCLLGLYFTCLLIVFILEVGVGIYALVQYDSVDELIYASMDEYILVADTDSAADQTFKSMQQNLKCCGGNGGCKDWEDAGVPDPYGCECTELEDGVCELYTDTDCKVRDTDTYANIYTQNCTAAMTTFIEDNMTVIAGIGLGIGLAELLGMIFAMCLCCAIKDKQGYA